MMKFKVSFEVNAPQYDTQTAPIGDMIRGDLLELLLGAYPEAADTLTVVAESVQDRT